MNTTEMREKSNEELTELKATLSRELWKARFDNYTNQLDNTASLGTLRRDIARVNTILSERSE